MDTCTHTQTHTHSAYKPSWTAMTFDLVEAATLLALEFAIVIMTNKLWTQALGIVLVCNRKLPCTCFHWPNLGLTECAWSSMLYSVFICTFYGGYSSVLYSRFPHKVLWRNLMELCELRQSRCGIRISFVLKLRWVCFKKKRRRKWHFCYRTLLRLAVFRVAFGHLCESCWSQRHAKQWRI